MAIPILIPPLPEQQEIVHRIESRFKFADETEKNACQELEGSGCRGAQEICFCAAGGGEEKGAYWG